MADCHEFRGLRFSFPLTVTLFNLNWSWWLTCNNPIEAEWLLLLFWGWFCTTILEHPPDRISVVSPWMVCLYALQSLMVSVGLWVFPLYLASSEVSVQTCVAIPVEVRPRVLGWSPAVVLMVHQPGPPISPPVRGLELPMNIRNAQTPVPSTCSLLISRVIPP